MSKQTVQSRDQIEDRSYDEIGGEPMAAENIADYARARRVRNRLLVANVVAWLLIIIAVKWLVF